MSELNLRREPENLVDSDFLPASIGGDTFLNDGQTVLWIKNESGAQRTVTVHAAGKCNHGFEHDHPIVIPASGTLQKSQTFPRGRFGGRPSITYDSVSGVSLVAVRQEGYIG